MGVQGLWELLSPVGRRVSVETLSGKILAIDASIWMIQFMKAMRDEKGDMVQNAHLIGFFRRICKLMFLRAKPVFVFDGGTPALKRRTVIARRRQRENAQAKVRKTAEKLLLNHLKAMRLKELAEDLESQRKQNDAKGKKVIIDEPETARNNVEETKNKPASFNQEELDAMLAASLAAEEDHGFAGNASTSGAGISGDEEDGDDDEDEEMILPEMSGTVDPAVLASLPPSMQLDLLGQMRERLMAENRQKYQKVKKAPAEFSELQIQSYLKTVAFRREIDQVQKAAAGKGVGGVQTSRIASESNREFIFSSSFTGDKDALASAGVEGHGKHFPNKQPSEISSALLESISSTSRSNLKSAPLADKPVGVPVKEIETHQDERQRFRARRMAMGIQMTRDLQRNLDMIKEIEEENTQRDEIVNKASELQKSFQFEETYQATGGSVHPVDPKAPNDDFSSRNESLMEISFEDDGVEKCLDGDDDIFARLVAGDAAMVSSVDNGSSKGHSFSFDSDYDREGMIKERIDSLTPATEMGNLSLPHAEGGDDDCEVEWEEDDLKYASKSPIDTKKMEARGVVEEEADMSSHAEGGDDDCEVEWEEDDLKYASKSPIDTKNIGSKGVLEEEADFQEALRRSLKDSCGNKSVEEQFDDSKQEEAIEIHEAISVGSLHQENENGGFLENVIAIDEFSDEVLNEVARIEAEAVAKKTISDDLSAQKAASIEGICDITKVQADIRCPTSNVVALDKELGEGEKLLEEIRLKSSCPGEEIGVHLIVEKQEDTSKTGSKVHKSSYECSEDGSLISDMVLGETSNSILAAAQPKISEAAAIEAAKQREIHIKESTANQEVVQKLQRKTDFDITSEQRGGGQEEFSFQDDLTNPIQYTKADLEDEIQILNQESIDLEDQQRKLNRNVEAVSSEMFAECQELLQIFGLPYIIAPMEAEAQCAYMELAGFVDGVVTDDSDAFLFGAKSVYKNIFDDRKYVETYLMKDIENELGLSRDKLIRMALLLGSDYTEGVSGIGIVNAIEVVNAFHEEDGFRKFREWIESPDPSIFGKVGTKKGSSSRKKEPKVSDSLTSCANSKGEGPSASEPQTTDHIDETKQLFMDKHRNVSKNWHIPSTFPNEAVISAYVSPEVDKSTEPFVWGKPDHFVLRKLCWEKFGWNLQKADELLVPVLKEYNKRETQLRMEAFYTFNEKFAKIRSKRIKKAVRGIRGNTSSELMDDDAQETSKSGKKRKVSPDKCLNDVTKQTSSERGNSLTEDEISPSQRSTKKLSSKKKHGESVPSDEKTKNSGMPSKGRKNNARVSGRGHRGRGRGRAGGRGRSMKFPELDSTGSSDDGSNSDSEKEMQVEKEEETHGVRKSGRSRKAVKYTLDDLDSDDPSMDDQPEMRSDIPIKDQSSKDHGKVEKDATSPIMVSQEKLGDPSLAECSNDAYLETGGGFCMEEADSEIDAGNISSTPKDDSRNEEEFSEEYLRVGGGFCLEEDGTEEEMVKRSSDESQDTYVHKGGLDHDSSAPSEVDHSKLASSHRQGTKEDGSHMVPAISLCAMPNLRRKGRKS